MSLAPTPEPSIAPPTATPAPTPPALEGLKLRLEEAVARYPVAGRYAVAVTDLRTGETVSVNGDRPQLAGCSINYFLLLQVTRDLQAGRHTITEVDGLVRTTTWSSNATTALHLYRVLGDGDALAGVARVDALIREELRLPNTILNHPPAFAGAINLRGGDNWLSANDANTALAALWRGEGLTPEWRSYLLDRLAAVEPGLNYLVGSVEGAVVHHKNGFFWYSGGYVDNDIGIVRLLVNDEEVPFAMSFLSEEVRTRYGDLALARELIGLAVDQFSAAP